MKDDPTLKHLTPYQRVLLADLWGGAVLSWSFIPHNIKNAVYDLIHVKRACQIERRRVGDDPREYEFVVLSDLGKTHMRQLL